MTRRSLLTLVAVLFHAMLFTTAAHSEVVQGQDYTLIAPAQPTSSPGKIEIVEFFSYGCPHCAQFHPSVTKWTAGLADDAVFVRVPVAFGRRPWGQLVRAYYALQETGDLARLDDALFKAIHREHKQLFDENGLAAWVAQQGGNSDAFRKAFNSSDVSRRAARAERMSREYRVSGVPQLAVNGKYLVIGQNYGDMLRIADELIEKERAALKGS